MKKTRRMQMYLLIVAILGATAIIGCSTSAGGGPAPAPVPDTTAPTVASTSPANSAAIAAPDMPVTATFSEAMDPATIAGNFTVVQGAASIDGAVTYDAGSKTASFTPTSPLPAGLDYTATIKIGVKDAAGNALAANVVWTFQPPILLRSAANYVIFGAAAMTNHGTSVITGDVGKNGTSIVADGFGASLDPLGPRYTSTQVAGYLYDQNLPDPATTVLGLAKSQMDLAYTDASTRTAPPANNDIQNLVATHIGGVAAFTPGVYIWGSAVTIDAGGITISGGPNDVWIFRMSGALNLADGISITLTGGAQAKNVYWAVGGATNLGVGSDFKGVLLGIGKVTLFDGATVHGKVLSKGALEMTSSTVKP